MILRNMFAHDRIVVFMRHDVAVISYPYDFCDILQCSLMPMFSESLLFSSLTTLVLEYFLARTDKSSLNYLHAPLVVDPNLVSKAS